MNDATDTRNATGHTVIQAFLKTPDRSPGVYRMLDQKGAVLSVGKARTLRGPRGIGGAPPG